MTATFGIDTFVQGGTCYIISVYIMCSVHVSVAELYWCKDLHVKFDVKKAVESERTFFVVAVCEWHR